MTTADTALAGPLAGLKAPRQDPVMAAPCAGQAQGDVGAIVIKAPPRASGDSIDRRLNATVRE